jgi:hypothetical protein
MICPNCNSSDLQKLSLIHAAGVYESRGRIRGLFLGNSARLHFGRYKGRSQSRLSTAVGSPKKRPYAAPTILWLIGFCLLMALDGRGKISTAMAMFSSAYVFLLPALLIGILVYNFFVYPKKRKNWERKFLCQRCGALAEIQVGTHAVVQAHP